MQVKKQQLEPDMEQQTGSKLGKEYIKADIVTLLFSLYAHYFMRIAGLDEAQLESRVPEETSITSDMQLTPLLWQKAKRN